MPVIEILLLYYKYIICLRHDETPLFVNWLRPLSLSLSLSHLSITIFTLMYFNEISGLKHSLDTPNHSRDIMNVRNYCTRKSMAYEMNPVQLRTDNNHFSGLGTSSKSWTPDYLESSARGLYW